MEAIVERGESAGAAGAAAEAAQGAGGADPFGFELFRNAIFAIADEMALTVCRTTYSGVLRDNMDFSTALTDGDGRLIAQGLTLPGHLGSVPTAIESVLRHYGDDIHPGDIYVMNDPFDGGMHLPDIFIFKPVFDGGERLAFAATVCHHADVGGRVAGSNASDSTEIYQEGVRIPPLRLYDKGARNETLFALLEKNVRLPVKLFGDLRAQLAACHIAERQFIELVRQHGAAGHALLSAGDHRLCRAPHPRRAPRPTRRRDELRGLDRRRRRRSRQADQAVRHAPQGGRQPPCRLGGLIAASEGRDQQHAVLDQGRHLHGDPLGLASGYPQQRGRVPRHHRLSALRHHHQRRAAGGLRRTRADRVPHGRLRLRGARDDAAR